jgi:hypothetical protein
MLGGWARLFRFRVNKNPAGFQRDFDAAIMTPYRTD